MKLRPNKGPSLTGEGRDLFTSRYVPKLKGIEKGGILRRKQEAASSTNNSPLRYRHLQQMQPISRRAKIATNSRDLRVRKESECNPYVGHPKSIRKVF